MDYHKVPILHLVLTTEKSIESKRTEQDLIDTRNPAVINQSGAILG